MNIQLALDHHIAGRFTQAEELYRKILQSDPQHCDALYLCGVLSLQTGRRLLACDLLEHAIGSCPSNPLYYTTLADILRDGGEFAPAAIRYRQALLCKPDEVQTLGKLANCLQQLRRFEEAIDCYRQALQIEPDSAEMHNDLGAAWMALGRVDDAIASLKKALMLKPDFSESHNNLGAAYKNKGNLDEAAACYHRALAIKPDYAKALFNLGTIFFLKKDVEPAVRWYRASLAVEPDQVEAHQNLAAIMLDAGRLHEAQRHRDLAYRKQAVFIDTAPNPVMTVLVLWAAGKGNVPIDYLLPKATVTRIVWMMEYATGEQARALPDHDLVFNAIGDPDVSGPTAGPVERFLRNCAKPVLNLPHAIERTARDRAGSLFASINDVVMPMTVRLDTVEIKEQLPARTDIRFPLIVRPSGSHGGEHLAKLETKEELRDLAIFNAPAYYATAFHDYRSSDGYYRKYRMIFIDRLPYAYHLAISKHWIVHYETADMQSESWKLREEQRFLENPAVVLGQRAMSAIGSIGRALDLDYCGLDFSLLPDGRVLVFEANATMLIHPEDESGPLAFKNVHVRRIFDAFNVLLLRAGSAAAS